MKNGGQLIVEALEAQGTQRVFCVPGESYLPLLDALHDSPIATTVCRHEGGAAMMAEAWGKLHNEPGVCMVTRGPGATNAAAGVHIAAQDSTPMVLFVGQINSAIRYREAFQEMDYQQLFGGMAKWVAEIASAQRIPELISRAWHIATSGRAGPVVLVLPEDTLEGQASVTAITPWKQLETYPGDDQLKQLAQLLDTASNPIAILGGSRWSAEAVLQMTQFSERLGLPVATTFRRQMLFDQTHANFAGDVGLGINPALQKCIVEADLVLLVGGRLSELPSQNFTLLNVPTPKQKLVHVHPGAEELGKVYTPTLAIHANPERFCALLATCRPATSPNWQVQADAAHADFTAWTSLRHAHPRAAVMRGVMQHLIDTLPADAILTNGAGNYSAWVHRFYPFRQYGTQLAPTSGSMGYGLPAAVAAKLARPAQTVIAFAGDGCFQMTMQEFGTAVQAGAAVIVLVIDNAMYGTIRMHQEKNYPGRISATTLENPDFALWAQAYGAYSATVNSAAEFKPAFDAALDATKNNSMPALLHIRVDPEAVTPTLAMTDFRVS